MDTVTRRDVLRGVAASSVLLPFVGAASERDEASKAVKEANRLPWSAICFSTGTGGLAEGAVQSGINVIHSYFPRGTDSDADIAKYQELLDRAHTLNVGAMLTLNGTDWAERRDGVASVLRIVEALDSHPALRLWFLADEPSGEEATVRQIQEMYDRIKKKGSKHPVAISFYFTRHLHSDIRKYIGALDVGLIEHYPVQEAAFPIENLNSVIERCEKAAHEHKKPFLPNVQIYRKPVAADMPNPRYPTREELRYWLHASLLLRWPGVSLWSAAQAVADNNYAFWNGTVLPTVKEFAEFANKVKSHRTPPLLYSGALCGKLLSDEKGPVILAVNRTHREAILNLGDEPGLRPRPDFLAPYADWKFVPIGSTREPTLLRFERNEMHTTILWKADPWEVAVWRLEEA